MIGELSICKTVITLSKLMSHPLIVAVASIFLGSVLIDGINRRKEKREQKRKESIKLFEEISDVLNEDLTWLFWQVRSGSHIIHDSFSDASRLAHKHRLQIKVKERSLFQSSSILKEYDSLIREIALLRRTIEEDGKLNKIDHSVIIENLKKKWNVTNDYKIEDLPPPFNQYFSWAQVIWYKSESFISELLEKTLHV